MEWCVTGDSSRGGSSVSPGNCNSPTNNGNGGEAWDRRSRQDGAVNRTGFFPCSAIRAAHRSGRYALAAAKALLFSAISAHGQAVFQPQTISIDSPALDKWYYPHAPQPTYGGTRDNAPVFANSGIRLSEALLGFQTSGSIATGLGASNYAVSSVKVYLRVNTDESFHYDPTYDGYLSYRPGSGTPDSDLGRPVELLGVGLRNGYTELRASAGGAHQFHENSPYSTGGIPNAYGFGIDANGQRRDVVQNVVDGFDYTPFAIGTTTAVQPGQLVPLEAYFEFSLNLSNPEILAYVQQGLNTGMLGFMVSSLHESSGQGGGTTYPGFYLRENVLDDAGDRFTPWVEIQYSVIPEPTPSLLVLVGTALFATGRAWRNRALLS